MIKLYATTIVFANVCKNCMGARGGIQKCTVFQPLLLPLKKFSVNAQDGESISQRKAINYDFVKIIVAWSV